MPKRAKKIPVDRQCEKCGKAEHEDRELEVAITTKGLEFERATIKLCCACLKRPFDRFDKESGEYLEWFILRGGPRRDRRVIGLIGSPAFPE